MKTFLFNEIEYPDELKLVHDLIYLSGQLPSFYKLRGIAFDRKHVIGWGEAIVSCEHMNKQRVAVREVIVSFSQVDAGSPHRTRSLLRL